MAKVSQQAHTTLPAPKAKRVVRAGADGATLSNVD